MLASSVVQALINVRVIRLTQRYRPHAQPARYAWTCGAAAEGCESCNCVKID
jgi:hypothetical protein